MVERGCAFHLYLLSIFRVSADRTERLGACPDTGFAWWWWRTGAFQTDAN
jgi:hypothetical protein